MCDYFNMGDQEAILPSAVPKSAGIWGSLIATTQITLYLVRKDKERLEMAT